MANVEHSTLTGSALHEPKGVSAASVGTVYKADGLGSGSWGLIGSSSMDGTGKSFQGQLLHVRDQKVVNTAGDSYASGAFQTRTLNTTVTNEIFGASLSGNQITLPSGTYYADITVLVGASNNGLRAKARLRNITNNATLIVGANVYMVQDTSGANVDSSAVNMNFPIPLKGRFTLSGSTAIELQVQTQRTSVAAAMNFTEAEVYADVLIWKTA